MSKNYVEEVSNQLLSDYKTALEEHRASGNLLNSLVLNVIADKDKWEIRIEGPEYGIFLENGTKPHFPPVDEILKWIRIKPVLPRPLADGKLPTEHQLAFLIGRSISIRGTEGTHSFDKTVDQNNYVERISLAIAKQLTSEFDEENIKKLFAPTTKRTVR